MPSNKETKHEAFRRLGEVRVGRALEEIRLVSQLSSRTYENTPEEAESIVGILDNAVQHVAKVFQVPFSSAIGEEAARRAKRTGHLVTDVKEGPINEMEVALAIEMITNGEPDTAKKILKEALTR